MNISLKIIFKYPNISKLDRKWSKEIFEYCNNWKKGSAPSRQKGVNVFDLQGKLIKKCATLKEADELTHVTIGRISNLCNLDDSRHQSKGYMFSRDKEIMEPYQASPSTNFRFLDAEGKALDKGEVNIEDAGEEYFIISTNGKGEINNMIPASDLIESAQVTYRKKYPTIKY